MLSFLAAGGSSVLALLLDSIIWNTRRVKQQHWMKHKFFFWSYECIGTISIVGMSQYITCHSFKPPLVIVSFIFKIKFTAIAQLGYKSNNSFLWRITVYCTFIASSWMLLLSSELLLLSYYWLSWLFWYPSHPWKFRPSFGFLVVVVVTCKVLGFFNQFGQHLVILFSGFFQLFYTKWKNCIRSLSTESFLYFHLTSSLYRLEKVSFHFISVYLQTKRIAPYTNVLKYSYRGIS